MNPTSRLHPSIPAIVFVLWWVVATLVFPHRMLNADGDMLRHITHGEWMLTHGRLITEDPFSFSRGGQPFVAFEYGSQILYALAHRAGGLAGVAIFAGFLIATAYAVIARFMLSRGVDALLAYLASIAAAVLGAVHWVARPHLLTLVLVAVLLHVLEPAPDPDGARRRFGPRWYAGTALLFAVWANLHGGFAFGLVLIGIYFAGSVLEMLSRPAAERAEPRADAIRYAAVFAVAALATFATPHFYKVHAHIIHFFGMKYLLSHTHEFLSPDFHSLVGKLLLLAILGVMTAFALTRERPHWRRLLVALAMTYFALTSQRNIQLFGATVFPVLALHFTGAWRRLPDWRGIRAVFDRDAKLGRTLPLAGVVTAAFLALFATRGRIGDVQAVPDAVSPDDFPVAVVERARQAGLTGRMFHDFIWGGYLLYAWPEQKVFIDGGTDFYGEEMMFTYINTSDAGPFWRDSLARWEFDRALLPTGSSLAHELVREPAWRIRDCDRTAVLLLREAGVGADTAAGPARLKQCETAPVTAGASR